MPTWIRVRDQSTGHQYDVLEQALPAAAGVDPVPGYPTHRGPRPRPPKHHTTKAGRRAPRPSRRAQPPAPPAETEGAAP